MRNYFCYSCGVEITVYTSSKLIHWIILCKLIMFYFLIDSMPASLDNKIQSDSCTNWDSRVFKVCFFFVLLFERDKTLH